MKRLLIITARYAPFIGPRAHRWTSLAEYWAAQGLEVHVVCPRLGGFPSYSRANGVQVHRTGFDSLKELGYFLSRPTRARGRVGAPVRKPGLPGRWGIWLYERIWKNLYFPDDAMLWYFPARRKVLQLLDHVAFDAVISVSLPFTGHLIGCVAKSRKPELTWLADIGDPFFIQARSLNNAFLYGRLNRTLEEKILRSADVQVVTTRATMRIYEEVYGAGAVSRMQVVPPLLHPFIAMKEDTKIADEMIHVGYFGAFYAPVRTPDAFLYLLERTFSQHPEWQSRLKIHFYGEIFPEFLARLKHSPNIELHGLRPRDEVQKAIQQMDILINIGNQTDFQLPSKAVEYLASGRPVANLSYVDDDPFIAFWDNQPGLLNLRVRQDRIEEKEMEKWLNLLKTVERGESLSRAPAHTQPFLIESIASQYAAALKAGHRFEQKKTASTE